MASSQHLPPDPGHRLVMNIVLSIVGPGVLAIAALFFQGQVSAARLEALLGQVQSSVSELKMESKERSAQFEALRHAMDVRMRQLEQRR